MEVGTGKRLNIQQRCGEAQFTFFLFLRFYLFLEQGEGREKERERNIDVREDH